MTPQITTVITTYRRPRLLRRAIMSVLNQTFADLQVRVYDNASGDETEAVVAELASSDPRVHYHRHPSNIGALENFMYGQREVDTPFFSFLSDDDVLLPDFYATTMQGFAQQPSAMFSAGATLEMTEDGGILAVSFANWPDEVVYKPPQALYHMLTGNYPSWTTILFRREVVDQIDYVPRTRSLSDLLFLLLIAERFPIVISKRPGGIFVRHPLAFSSGISADRLGGYAGLIEHWRSGGALAPQDRSGVVARLSRLATRRALELGVWALIQRDHDTAREVVQFLRNEVRHPMLAVLLEAGSVACKTFPPVTGALRSAAAIGQSLRGWWDAVRSASSPSGNAPRDFATYRRYLRLPER